MPDDGLIREVLDGELFATPAPSPLHQRVAKRLQRQLEAFFETRHVGEVFNAPVDVILGTHDVVEPDLVIVTEAALVTRRAIEGAPLLLVEVLSPSTAERDRTLKARRYAAAGVPHYWIVDIGAGRIDCWRLSEQREYVVVASAQGDENLAHPDWPALMIDLDELWK